MNQRPSHCIARRYFLRECGIGLGKVAAAGLLTNQLAAATVGHSSRRNDEQQNLLSPRPPHFKPKAKAVIHLFMAGAPSQLELFDPKPKLTELEGKPLPQINYWRSALRIYPT